MNKLPNHLLGIYNDRLDKILHLLLIALNLAELAPVIVMTPHAVIASCMAVASD